MSQLTTLIDVGLDIDDVSIVLVKGHATIRNVA
jgi:hypothetical protein